MIDFKNVSKKYEAGIQALNNVSFHADHGEFFFVVGPSGAGKSTLIRLLIRQELPSEGQVFFEGVEVNNLPATLLPVYRQQFGIVFQDLKLIETKTVEENIRFALEIVGKGKKEINETTDYLLELVKLTDHRHLHPQALSGGEMQKVAIARALASDPILLIADEPTGNIDPESSLEILSLLQTINSWGTTVMCVTHDREIVDQLQTRVIHMDNGEIIADTVGGYENKKKRRK